MIQPMERPAFPQADLADRLRRALDESGVSQADLGRACGVTDQAVHGWVTNGRIGKQHLPTISALTGKGLDYFLVGLKMGRRAAAIALAFLVPLLMQPQESHASAASFDRVSGSLCIMLKRLWGFIYLFYKEQNGLLSNYQLH